MAINETMRIIVAGSRNFSNYRWLEERLDFYIGRHQAVQIVSGTARGADQLGELYAKNRGLPLERFPAEWDD